MKNEIKKKISFDIFRKDFDLLNNIQKEFVLFQIQEYKKYKKRIREKVISVKSNNRLSSYEYSIIEGYFFERIPLSRVISGINQGVKISQQYNQVIFSIGYFRPYIYAEYKKYIQSTLVSLEGRVEKRIDKWLFVFYELWKNGTFPNMIFDPFEGLIRREENE